MGERLLRMIRFTCFSEKCVSIPWGKIFPDTARVYSGEEEKHASLQSKRATKEVYHEVLKNPRVYCFFSHRLAHIQGTLEN